MWWHTCTDRATATATATAATASGDCATMVVHRPAVCSAVCSHSGAVYVPPWPLYSQCPLTVPTVPDGRCARSACTAAPPRADTQSAPATPAALQSTREYSTQASVRSVRQPADLQCLSTQPHAVDRAFLPHSRMTFKYLPVVSTFILVLHCRAGGSCGSLRPNAPTGREIARHWPGGPY